MDAHSHTQQQWSNHPSPYSHFQPLPPYHQHRHPASYTAPTSSTPTPPHSNSSNHSSPSIAYAVLHNQQNSPYSQPIQHLQPLYAQSQQQQQQQHQVPIQSSFPRRPHIPRPVAQQQQQAQSQLPQQDPLQAAQQHYSPLIHSQQLLPSPHFQAQPIPSPPTGAPGPATPASVASSSSAVPRRSSPGGAVHSDAIYAPQAAALYAQANALAAQQQQQQQQGADLNGYTSGGSTPPRLPPILQVEKQQVTTSATQAASASRRRNEAHFICPVPGCGSTFTRRFNLRGHLRSHTEERPYVCEWPGCNKGFARQHDCKRHQALHQSRSTSNVCHGCGKTFSRLDALNRHLRSEGGQECKRPHQLALAAQKQNPPAKPNPLSAFRAGTSAGTTTTTVSAAPSNGGGYTMDAHPAMNGHSGHGHGHGHGHVYHLVDSGSSAYDSDGSLGIRSVQATPHSGPAPSLAAV